ncbi:hypothetical protein ACFV7Q_05190 [Streptomyces sp. NPDC059851]|uniref:hypothetical protein n=1 Tax=Streptomyces sp. NPDC059851 TaxID=3346971 RepID=UPI0036495303
MSSYPRRLPLVVATVALALVCAAQAGQQAPVRVQADGVSAEVSGPVMGTALSTPGAPGDIRWD